MQEFKINKPRIFIGSSEKNKTKAANAKKVFEKTSDVTVWNKNFFDRDDDHLQSLLNYIGLFDYAVLIMSPDTLVKKDAVEALSRDHMIFELGLCLGRLGKNSTFVLCEDGVSVPTELAGIDFVSYKDTDKKSFPAACKVIGKKLLAENKKTKLNLTPAATIANSYCTNFLLPTLQFLLSRRTYTIGSSKGILRNTDLLSVEINIILFDKLDKFTPRSVESVVKRENLERVFIEGTRSRTLQLWVDLNQLTVYKKLVIYDVPMSLELLKHGLNEDLISPDFIHPAELVKQYEKSQVMNFAKTIRHRLEKQFKRYISLVNFI